MGAKNDPLFASARCFAKPRRRHGLTNLPDHHFRSEIEAPSCAFGIKIPSKPRIPCIFPCYGNFDCFRRVAPRSKGLRRRPHGHAEVLLQRFDGFDAQVPRLGIVSTATNFIEEEQRKLIHHNQGYRLRSAAADVRGQDYQAGTGSDPPDPSRAAGAHGQTRASRRWDRCARPWYRPA
jgi:hypothetical protein